MRSSKITHSRYEVSLLSNCVGSGSEILASTPGRKLACPGNPPGMQLPPAFGASVALIVTATGPHTLRSCRMPSNHRFSTKRMKHRSSTPMVTLVNTPPTMKSYGSLTSRDNPPDALRHTTHRISLIYLPDLRMDGCSTGSVRYATRAHVREAFHRVMKRRGPPDRNRCEYDRLADRKTPGGRSFPRWSRSARRPAELATAKLHPKG